MLGRVDELSLYNRALTVEEITSIYEAGSMGKYIGEPPTIAVQPVDQVVNAGTLAVFAVQATGTEPLSYQWRLNDTALSGATGRELVLTNVQPGQAGSYSVWVSNMFGGVLSSNATLSVVTQQCAGVPLGLIGWWKAEGSTFDSALTNHAFAVGFPQFGPGKVGAGFLFGGTNAYRVPSSRSMNVASFTIESWIKSSATAPQPIAGFGNEIGYGPVQFWQNLNPGGSGAPGALYGFVRGTNGSYLEISTAAGVVPTNAWVHVAFTMNYSTKIAQLFVNGVPVAYATNQDLAVPDTAVQFNIGRRPEGMGDLLNGYRFWGAIDELSLYNRALTADEISSLYQSANGKCSIPGRVTPGLPNPPMPLLPVISPVVPTSPPLPGLPIGRTNCMGLVLRGTPGEIYRIQRADTLVGPWQDVGSATMDALGRGAFEDTKANSQKGFYRLVK
jgi:hypothetical protein